MEKIIGVLWLGISSNLYPRKSEEQGRLSKKTDNRKEKCGKLWGERWKNNRKVGTFGIG